MAYLLMSYDNVTRNILFIWVKDSIIEIARSYFDVIESQNVLATIFERRYEKTNVLVSDLVRHKPGCTAIEDGLKFRIKKVEGLYHMCSENKGADLRFCFCICKTLVFS